MKKLVYIIIFGLIVSFVGCYKDLGNYEYKDINEFSIDILPKAQEYDEEFFLYNYVYRQPANEAFEITYKPAIVQTLNKDDSSLEFEWIVLKNESKRDTIKANELTLRYEPKVKTTYKVRLKVSDKTNNISKYRELNIRTELPFVKSWLVLHGKEGDRRLGAVERPDNKSESEVLSDVYGIIHDKPNPFYNVINMFYTPADGSNFNKPEHLTLLEANKTYYIHPFDMGISKRDYNLMIPNPSANTKLSYGVTNSATGRNAIIVTEEGKFFHGGPNGFYYMPNTLPEVSNYHVDKAYIAQNGMAVIWDNIAKRFLYLNLGDNWYGWYEGDGRPPSGSVSVDAPLTPFSKELFLANELANKEVLWIGPPYDSSIEAGASVVLRDISSNTLWLYLFNFDTYYDSDVTIEKKDISDIVINSKSLFALSVAFSHQLFYTLGETLYHYNIVTQDNSAIYTLGAGDSFSQLKFRESYSHYMVENENHKLGLGVLLANGLVGELHELTFSQSGDIIDQATYGGGAFGPIKDIDFTFIHRIIK